MPLLAGGAPPGHGGAAVPAPQHLRTLDRVLDLRCQGATDIAAWRRNGRPG